MAIESQNIYKNARKSAGFTQEKASQLLNVSVDSLRDYEQSQRPVPSDVASAMCDVYQAPYLAVQHLRLTSDLGKRVVPEIQLKDLPEAVLGVLAAVQRFCAKREAMVEIAADGQIAESEQAEWDEIMRLANDLNVAIKKHSDELSEFSQQALSSLETADAVANAIGSQAKSMIQDAIKDEEWAPNAPITIEGGWMMNEYGKKGPVPVHIEGKSSTKPLIDTGTLRQNCQYVITKGKK